MTFAAEDYPLGSVRWAERYLYRDAALLDEWRLREWFAGMAPDIQYLIPATDLGLGPPLQFDIVADDHQLLESRVNRLLSGRAYAEVPLSRTRRFISNTQIVSARDGEIDVHANFIIHRFRRESSDSYVGRYQLTLAASKDSEVLMTKRHAILDHYDLAGNGGLVSILL